MAEYCILKEARDFVMLYHWFSRPEDNSLCCVAHSVEHPLCQPQEGFLRGVMHCAGYLISPVKSSTPTSRVTRMMNMKVLKAPEIIQDMVSRVEVGTLRRLRQLIEKGIVEKKNWM